MFKKVAKLSHHLMDLFQDRFWNTVNGFIKLYSYEIGVKFTIVEILVLVVLVGSTGGIKTWLR